MGNRACLHSKVKRRRNGTHSCTLCGEGFVSATAIADARQQWLLEPSQGGKNEAMVLFGATRALTLIEPEGARERA